MSMKQAEKNKWSLMKQWNPLYLSYLLTVVCVCVNLILTFQPSISKLYMQESIINFLSITAFEIKVLKVK